MSTQDHAMARTARRLGPGRGRLLGGTLAAAATLALAAGTTAAAGAEVLPTSVSIDIVHRANRDVFKGVVSSPNQNCVGGRRVRLLRKQPGPDALIGRDRSEDNGHWSVDVEGGAAPGTYYAKVRESSLGADTCASATSPTITVG